MHFFTPLGNLHPKRGGSRGRHTSPPHPAKAACYGRCDARRSRRAAPMALPDAWQVCAALAAALLAALIHRALTPARGRAAAPVVPGLPLLGNTLALGLRGAAFIHDCRAAHGDAFTASLAGRQMTFLFHPDALAVFFSAPDADIEFRRGPPKPYCSPPPGAHAPPATASSTLQPVRASARAAFLSSLKCSALGNFIRREQHERSICRRPWEAGRPLGRCCGPVCSRLVPTLSRQNRASCGPPGRRWSGSPGACSSCRRAHSSRAMRRCWAVCAACWRPASCGRTRRSWPRARARTWRPAGPSAGRRAAPGAWERACVGRARQGPCSGLGRPRGSRLEGGAHVLHACSCRRVHEGRAALLLTSTTHTYGHLHELTCVHMHAHAPPLS